VHFIGESSFSHLAKFYFDTDTLAYITCLVRSHRQTTNARSFAVAQSSSIQARNQLGTPGGGAKSFLRWAQIFRIVSNSLNLSPTHFSRGVEKFSRGSFSDLAVEADIQQTFVK